MLEVRVYYVLKREISSTSLFLISEGFAHEIEAIHTMYFQTLSSICHPSLCVPEVVVKLIVPGSEV